MLHKKKTLPVRSIPWHFQVALDVQHALANDPLAFRVLIWVANRSPRTNKRLWALQLKVKPVALQKAITKLEDLGYVSDATGLLALAVDNVTPSKVLGSSYLGLTGRALQIYARIFSRTSNANIKGGGVFYESLSTVAKYFKCDRRTVAAELTVLVDLGLLLKTCNHMQTCNYTINKAFCSGGRSNDYQEKLQDATGERYEMLEARLISYNKKSKDKRKDDGKIQTTPVPGTGKSGKANVRRRDAVAVLDSQTSDVSRLCA